MTAEEVERFTDVVVDGNLAYPERVALSGRMRALGMFQVVERA